MRNRVELADLQTMDAEIRRRSFAYNRARNRRSRNAGVGAGTPAPQVPVAQDLRLLSTSSDLKAWWRVENNLVRNTTLLASGTAPPAVTVAWASNAVAGFMIKIYSSTTYRWSLDNGWTWQGGAGNILTIPNGSTVNLGGDAVTFPAGTYGATQEFRATAQSLADLVTGAVLDNSTVAATTGPYVETPSNERPTLRCQPNIATGYLGNQSGPATTLFSGLAKPFHTFFLSRITSTNISTLAVALWSATKSNNNTNGYIYSIFFGDAAPANKYTSQRRSDAGVTVPIDFLVSLDYSDHIFEHRYDGTNMRFLIDGFQIGADTPWSGASITPDRLIIGAVKLGTAAAALQAYQAWSEWAGYQRVLTDPEADAVRKTIAWAA